MEPSINDRIASSFDQLGQVADNFRQEKLNDGEAGHIRALIEKHLEALAEALGEVPSLDDKAVKQLENKLHNLEAKLNPIFSEENETTFAPLQEAHQSYNETKREIQLMMHHPDLVEFMSDIDSFLEEAENETHGNTLLNTLDQVQSRLLEVEKYVETHAEDIETGEALWIRDYLKDKQDDCTEINTRLIRSSPKKEEIDKTVDSIQNLLVESGFEVPEK